MGTTFSCRGGSIQWAPETSHRTSFTKPKTYGRSEKEKSEYDLELLRRRRMTSLIHKIGSLKKLPLWFISLILDRKVKREWDIEECLAIFTKFRRWLEREFLKSWFIFVMEFKPRGGLHYHLLGRFGQKMSKMAKEAVREKWMKVTGSKNEKAAQIDDYLPEIHRSYVTTNIKASGTRELLKLLGQKSFWGCINRKNMPLHDERQFTLDYGLDGLFRQLLQRALSDKYGNPENHRRRSIKQKGCFGFASPEMIEECLQETFRIEEDANRDYDPS